MVVRPLSCLLLLAAARCGGSQSAGPVEPEATVIHADQQAAPVAEPPPLAPIKMQVVGAVQPGRMPTHMALSADGGLLYVVLEGGADNGAAVAVIDTAASQTMGTVALGQGYAFQIALAPQGRRAYVALSQGSGSTRTGGGNRVVAIDTEQHAVASLIPVGGGMYGPIGIAVAPDGARVYTTNRGSNRVEVIDPSSNAALSPIQVGICPIGIAITRDGSRAYVANRNTSTVTVFDPREGAVSATIPIELRQSDSTTSIALSPDGRLAFVTHSTDSRIAVLDTAPQSPTYNQQLRLIETPGSSLAEIAFVEGAPWALVVSRGSDELLGIEMDPSSSAYLTVQQQVQVGDSPVDVVIRAGPDGRTAYVSSSGDDSLSLVQL
jgi:YVTN family beta-propeller protein